MFQVSLANSQFELDRQVCKDVTIAEGKSFDVVQLKYDGIWGAAVRRHREDTVTIYSRNGLVKDVFDAPGFPEETVLIGEFMFGSQWAQHPHRVGKIFLYDCAALNGVEMRTMSYTLRYSALKSLSFSHPRFEVVSSSPVVHIDSLHERLQVLRAFEGFVFRRWDDSYDKACGRFKYDIEEDYVVMRINTGTGKHTGRMGSLTVGQYKNYDLVEIMDVGGGFTDAEREAPPSVGSVILVQGKCKFTSGALRHPNFIRQRSDKTRFECIFVEPTQ